jgi:hypothetical protein
MTLTHELGHLLGGAASGAVLSALEIRPWHLPYSLFASNPNPLLTLWAGPVIGCSLPLLFALVTGQRSMWFIAWFCVLANAAYLLLGWLSGDAELDSAKIRQAGTPTSVLLLFVVMTGPVSYVGFRRECVCLLSDPDRALRQRTWSISAACLLMLMLVQACLGTLVAPD